jgi:hypothetical protein
MSLNSPTTCDSYCETWVFCTETIPYALLTKNWKITINHELLGKHYGTEIPERLN